jgi:hypothetical protein
MDAAWYQAVRRADSARLVPGASAEACARAREAGAREAARARAEAKRWSDGSDKCKPSDGNAWQRARMLGNPAGYCGEATKGARRNLSGRCWMSSLRPELTAI